MFHKALAAEFVGTFSLILAICGTALFSAPSAGLIAVALAAGISILAMIYAVGHISGGHFNPAVTLGLVAAGRFKPSEAPGYIVAQLLGGCAAAGVLALILSGAPADGTFNSFTQVSNAFGGKFFGMSQVFVAEIVLTALFVFVIVGVTSERAPKMLAPLAIGLMLTLCHLIAIPVDNASINPARSTAAAMYGGSDVIGQLWMFWLAPILGGVLGGLLARWIQDEQHQAVVVTQPVVTRLSPTLPQ
ncbi:MULTISPECIES: aquaporin [Rhodomicrobium]|uniref:aquaporin n=1 Tax=Rhodomicrobium TaxID=1068 RepID=UPI000B4B6D0B|nr:MULTISPECIES: aquaporin [Rhodomicrobium]